MHSTSVSVNQLSREISFEEEDALSSSSSSSPFALPFFPFPRRAFLGGPKKLLLAEEGTVSAAFLTKNLWYAVVFLVTSVHPMRGYYWMLWQ